MIEVVMIGGDEAGFHVVTFWTEGDEICVSVMGIGVKACIVVTCCMEGEGIRTSVMWFGTKAFIGETY